MDFKYATDHSDPAPRQSWLKFFARIALIVLFGFLVGFVVLPGMVHAQVRQAVVADPAQARGSDVRALIAEDLETYLAGGRSALGWSQVSVLATTIASDYRRNEVAADRKYMSGDGDIVITGVVAHIARTFNTPVIHMHGPLMAYMAKGHDNWLAAIKPNDKVSVACQRARQVLGMVGVYECEPRAAYVGRMAEWYQREMMPKLAAKGDPMAIKLTQIASRS